MATTRIKIGFAVLQTSLYHPLRMAEQISLIDNLSKGRLIVGLGRGSLVNTHEYAGYQIDPDSAQERFEEIEQILLKCWNGERVVHAGKYWNFEIPHAAAAAVHQAASADPAQRRLARLADGDGAPGPSGDHGGGDRGRRRRRAPISTARRRRKPGLSSDAIDSALDKCWVARTVILAPTEKEATEVGLPHFKAMQTYRAAQSEKFDAKVAKANANMAPQILCGAPDSMMDEFTALQKTGIGGCIVRFRTGPMPAEFANRGLQLFMKHIAPAIGERTLATV